MNGVGKVKIIIGLPSKERWSRIAFVGMTLIVLTIGTICIINAIKWIDRPFPGFLLNQRLVVGGVGQYQWTGTHAGLKYPDKLLKADNRVVSSISDLENVISNIDVGTPVNYTFKRGEELIELTIPTMLFSLTDFLVIVGTYFFVATVYLLMGVIVFVLKPYAKVSWIFLIACFFLSLYYILIFDLETNYTFVRFFIFVNIFLCAVGIHFSMIFPEQKRYFQRYPYLQLIPYGISMIIASLMEIYYLEHVFETLSSVIYIYMFVTTIALFISVLTSYFKKTSLLAKQRAKVVLFGVALAFPLPAIATILFVRGTTFFGVQIQSNFLSLPMLIFPFSIAYAISKHNLFDVDVYIKRTVGYIIMTVIVGIAYFSIQTILSTFVLHPILDVNAERIVPILFALLIVFLFNPINRRVQGTVDKIFFRKEFDYKDTIGSVSNKLTSLLKLNEIIKQLTDTLREKMYIDTAGVILFEPRKKSGKTLFVNEGSHNVKDHKDVYIDYNDPLLTLISREKKLITKYDIEEDPRYSAIKEPCGKRFQEIGASLAIPLIYQGEVKGVITLGQKKSGHFYTREDIDLLKTLANHGVVAMENAKFFEQIKKEEARFRTLIQTAPSVIICLSTEGNIIEFNPEAERIYGRRREEVLGQNYLELFIPYEERETVFGDVKKVLDGKLTRGYENCIVNVNGSKSFFTWNVKRLIDDSGHLLGIVAVGQDITDRKKMEEALFQSEKLKALGVMASGIAHEFNNILAIIKGYAQLLGMKLTDKTELKNGLSTINRATNDGIEIVKRMKDFTSVNKGEPWVENVDIKSSLEQAIAYLRPRWRDMAQARKIKYRIDTKGLREVPLVRGTSSELREVLVNILNNALDAMSNGGCITVRTLSDGNSVFAGITDNGKGIPDEEKSQIFDPFFTTRMPEGTGLGMSASYGIIKKFGGTIDVESKMGVGTTFTLKLPIARETTPLTTPLKPIKEAKSKELNILVVDDEREMCNVIGEYLSKDDHNVRCVYGGSDALTLLKSESFDLLICDLVMPELSGYDVIKALDTVEKRPKVGLITGWAVNLETIKSEELNVDFVLKKPFDFTELSKNINTIFSMG